MPVLTPFERHAMERGEGLGPLRTGRDAALTALELRFGTVPERIAERVSNVESLDLAQKLYRLAITATTMEEFERGLPPA